MENRLSRLESKVDEASRLLADLERRIAALEGRLGAPGPAARPPTAESPTAGVEEDLLAPRLPSRSDVTRVLPLVGRTLVVLAGAYLLRAVTEWGVIPPPAGVALGMAYAVLWVVVADLAGGGKRFLSAGFHAATSAVIAFPLLWEATSATRFGLLPGPASAALVAVTSVAGLAAAWHRRLATAAWIFTAGGVCTALVLGGVLRAFVPFTCALLVLGCVTLWLAYVRDWHALSGFVGFVLDTTVLLLTAIVLVTPEDRRPLAPEALMGIQLALLFAYLGSFAARTLVRGRNITPLEVAQTVAVLLIGLGGAIWVSQATQIARTPLTVVSLLMAIGFYGSAFVIIDRRTGGRQNFIYYSTLGLIFALVTGGEFLERDLLPVVFATMGALAAWLGGRFARVTLTGHSAFYALAAAFSSGLLARAADALLAQPPEAGGWLTLPVLTTLGATCVSCWILAPTHGRTWGRFARAPKLVLVAVALSGIYGLTVSLGAAAFAETGESGMDAGALAVLRTATLAVGAVTLAWFGRWKRFLEAGWLVYPVLAAGGIKLLLEDLPTGRYTTLFASFASFGSALILAPWLARRRE